MKPKCLSCPYFSLEQMKLLKQIAGKIEAIERLEQLRIDLVKAEIEKINKINDCVQNNQGKK